MKLRLLWDRFCDRLWRSPWAVWLTIAVLALLLLGRVL